MYLYTNLAAIVANQSAAEEAALQALVKGLHADARRAFKVGKCPIQKFWKSALRRVNDEALLQSAIKLAKLELESVKKTTSDLPRGSIAEREFWPAKKSAMSFLRHVLDDLEYKDYRLIEYRQEEEESLRKCRVWHECEKDMKGAPVPGGKRYPVDPTPMPKSKGMLMAYLEVHEYELMEERRKQEEMEQCWREVGK